MTARDAETPRDYTAVSQESPREAVANVSMTLRAIGEKESALDRWCVGARVLHAEDLLSMASRLEDACRKLDVLEHERGRLENVWRDADARADAAEAEQVRLSVQLTQRARDLEEALIWCSGSPSFAPEGEAREGWLKLCAPLLGSR